MALSAQATTFQERRRTGFSLRHQVSFQTNTESGWEGADTWATDFTVRASIRTLAGRELETASAVTAETTHEITIRYRSGVVVGQRISWNDGGDTRTFDILSIQRVPDGVKRWLVLLVKEGRSYGS